MNIRAPGAKIKDVWPVLNTRGAGELRCTCVAAHSAIAAPARQNRSEAETSER